MAKKLISIIIIICLVSNIAFAEELIEEKATHYFRLDLENVAYAGYGLFYGFALGLSSGLMIAYIINGITGHAYSSEVMVGIVYTTTSIGSCAGTVWGLYYPERYHPVKSERKGLIVNTIIGSLLGTALWQTIRYSLSGDTLSTVSYSDFTFDLMYSVLFGGTLGAFVGYMRTKKSSAISLISIEKETMNISFPQVYLASSRYNPRVLTINVRLLEVKF